MLIGQFNLPVGFDLAAVFLFGLTGALFAMKKGYDIVGVFVMALITGAGSGLIRDGIFLQQGPPALVTDERYLYAVGISGCLGLLFGRHVIVVEKWFDRGVSVVDAAALGTYAIVGAQKAINAGLGVSAAFLIGVINAVGASLIRDVLTQQESILLKPGQFYAFAAAVGCIVFLILGPGIGISAEASAFIAIAVTFLLRVAAIRFNWQTAPAGQEKIRDRLH
jgi:uncharacterized membrane protein YeiH